ncbi:MAG: XdhC family protein [Acidimicrobiales bacterium]
MTSSPSAFAVTRDAIRAEEPVVLATVVELEAVPEDYRSPGGGAVELPSLGAKLVLKPSGASSEAVGAPDRGPGAVGSLGNTGLDRAVALDALGAVEAGVSSVRHYGPEGEARRHEVTVFFDVFAPPRRMIIFGAVDFTSALVKVAKVLGYKVTVCDARSVFATAARLPGADEIVVDWPQRYLATVADELGPRDAVCVLTHDHKFDVPAIIAALQSNVGYLGAMGARRTHAERLELLRAAGVDDEKLARVMAPIGIDIGARTPEETAVAICAEIISLRSQAPILSLRDRPGPIHPQLA